MNSSSSEERVFQIRLIGPQVNTFDGVIYSVSSLWALGFSLFAGTVAGVYILTGNRQSRLKSNLLTAYLLHLFLSMSSDVAFFLQHVYRLAYPDSLDICGTVCALLSFLPMICMAQVPWMAIINYIAVTNAIAPSKYRIHTKGQVMSIFMGLISVYSISIFIVMVSTSSISSFRGMYWAGLILTPATLIGYVIVPVILSAGCIIILYTLVWLKQYELARTSRLTNAKEIGRKILERGFVVISIFILVWFPLGVDFIIFAIGKESPYAYSFAAAILAKLETFILAIQIVYLFIRSSNSPGHAASSLPMSKEYQMSAASEHQRAGNRRRSSSNPGAIPVALLQKHISLKNLPAVDGDKSHAKEAVNPASLSPVVNI